MYSFFTVLVLYIGHTSWNYDDQVAWGKMEGCEVANTGKRQSPIDIQTCLVKINGDLTPLKFEVSYMCRCTVLHGKLQACLA